MLHRSELLRCALLLCAFLGASRAMAETEPGFYFGGGIGWANVAVSKWSDYNHDCCNGYDDYYYQEGDADSAFSAHAGYRVMPYLAVEVGFLDSGSPQWNENFVYIGELADVYNVFVDFTKLQATEVSVLGILPFLNVWEAYLRIGAAFWSADTDQTAINSFTGAPLTRSINSDDTGWLLGFGIGASPMPHWHFRFELQTYSIDEDLLGGFGDANADAILLEAQYRL